MAAEELPNELDKLKIGPILPQIKLNNSIIPVSLNPFYNDAADESSGLSGTERIFGDVKCSCRMRRRSESILDDCKQNVTYPSISRIEHTIRNPVHFKHKNRKKTILREPILKSLQKCLHPKHLNAFGEIPSRSTNKSIDHVDDAEDEFNKSCPTIEALNLDDTINSLRINKEKASRTSANKSSSGMTDFKDLIAECQLLLETNFNFNSWSASIASRKNLKNFNVIQSAGNRRTTMNRQKLRKNKEISSREEGTRQCGGLTTSTSCSQQARINASTVTVRAHPSSIASTSPCDVTIDELASYFETFVHIPKKMSSMAEMMYI